MASYQDAIHWGTIISGATGGAVVGLFSLIVTGVSSLLQRKIQREKEENEDKRFRTSLFFDHKRAAFGELLAKIANIQQKWQKVGYDFPDGGIIEPVPSLMFDDLENVFYKHQLFLDESCIAAMELVFECYGDSFSEISGDGGLERSGKEDLAYDSITYLQPRLAKLFQQRIGVSSDNQAIREIALLGAIRLLNHYHFEEIGLPPSEGNPLKLDRAGPAEAVSKAEINFNELCSYLKKFQRYLRNDHRFFHEAEMKISRYLTMLEER